jgi:hypothetical protein
MSAWSHLPNAVHIDRVLALIKSHPKLWDQAWSQVWNQAFDQAWGPASRQARDQAWYQAWDQAWDRARADQASDQARGTILALVAYDDCAKYLNLPIDQLQMLYQLTEHPACILLQPAVVAFAMEKERELAQG